MILWELMKISYNPDKFDSCFFFEISYNLHLNIKKASAKHLYKIAKLTGLPIQHAVCRTNTIEVKCLEEFYIRKLL